MVKTCCVKNCDIAPTGNVTCFRFPNNRYLKRKWIDAIGLSNKLTANSTVCIKHFQESDYDIVRGRPRLKAKVIPSVFSESDKVSLDSRIPEDDFVSNEINNDITLQNLQTDNLSLTEDSVEVQNVSSKESDEGRTEHSEGRAIVNTEKSTEGRTDLQIECSTDVLEDNSTKLQNGGSTISEGRTELHNESKTELHNECREELQKEDSTETHEDNTKSNMVSTNVQDDGGVEVQSENEKKEGNEEVENEITKKNDKEGVEEVQKSGKIKPNGVILKKKSVKGYQDSFIESATRGSSIVDDLNKDIEDIIVNYQIKQTRPVHVHGEPVAPQPLQEDLLKESEPVFIEMAVQGDRAGSPRDCLMVLESVQVELDPSAFLAAGEPHDCHETVDLAADDDDLSHRPEPISLLTSSDEDEVVIQEPHIDTVEVSDETDEDDVPLVRLLKPKRKTKPKISIWNAYEYFCMECQYTAGSRREYRAHTARHSTVLHVCDVCDYTTASKTQFSRHKRKHKEDKKFRCHLCDYKARHNMSLIYHLRSHRALSSASKGFRCDRCGFKSDVKTVVLKHVKLCSSDVKKYSCDECVYETKRPSDLRRHQSRRHGRQRDDEDEFVP